MKNQIHLSAKIQARGIRGIQREHKLTFEIDEFGRANLIQINGRWLGDDPRGRPMRQPNAYETIIRDIENASTTWLPAILAKTISECIKKSVFREGGLLEFVTSKLKT